MFSNTYKKVLRDGENIYRHARYVIVIDSKGAVVEKIDRISGSLINVLAVIGPLVIDGTRVERSVRAEIGFGRTSPYTASEKMVKDINFRFPRRYVHSPLTEGEQFKLLHEIANQVQKVVDNDVMHRRRLTYLKNIHRDDSAEYGNGKFITIPSNFPLFMFAGLAKDMETREKGHLDEFVNNTKLRLSRLRCGTYSSSEMKRIKVAQYIAYLLSEAKYGEHIMSIIKEKLGKESGKVRVLFEQLLEAYSIVPSVNKDTLYLSLLKRYELIERYIISFFPLDVVTHPKREEKKSAHQQLRIDENRKTYRHAVDCLRVEVRPSLEAIQKHEQLHSG